MAIRPLFASAAAAAVLLFGLAGVSEAGSLVLNQETGKYSSSDGGGEFKVTSLSGFPGAVPAMGSGVQVTTNNVTGAFQTFCLEYSEHFNPGATYNFTISDSATAGGVSGATNGADPISAQTAYLYTQFWNGTLSWVNSSNVTENYVYTLGTGRAASALELQRAIWYLEGERTLSQIGGANSDAYKMVEQANSAVATNGSWWNLYHDAGGAATIGNVRVMNLTHPTTGAFAQSQLTMIAVPLPPAALLGFSLMSGAGLVGWLRRRRRRELA
jgi:hypothetical protein